MHSGNCGNEYRRYLARRHRLQPRRSSRSRRDTAPRRGTVLTLSTRVAWRYIGNLCADSIDTPRPCARNIRAETWGEPHPLADDDVRERSNAPLSPPGQNRLAASAPLAALNLDRRKVGSPQILDLDVGRQFIRAARAQTRRRFGETNPPEVVVTGRVLSCIDQLGTDLRACFKR